MVRGRLWRRADPSLPDASRQALVAQLMTARRALRGQGPRVDREAARRVIDEAKRGLGERGPVWWTDGTPDYNRRMVANTPYADWYAGIELS